MTSSRFERAPLVETERLRLRGVTRSDFDACHAVWSDPEVTRFIGGKPSTREETWRRMIMSAGLWSLLGYGFWVIEERASGRIIGDIGAMQREREMEPPLGHGPEVGWALAPSVHGKGYASEALGAMLGWLDANVASEAIVCIIDPDNFPSLRLAAKFGFRERAQAIYQDKPVIQFERRGS